ncbi:thiamine phosphate synthase [Arcticibacter sp. MXS-1]|uniref:thiamine phosphate synthase n=1 Tax=Arcticibacter sp. MXS-1 TaxID=3341726 RepID=UPI0035A8B7B6
MKKYISKLHYITHDIAGRSHVEQVRMACEAGANWVQYRCFSKPEAELIDEAQMISEICDEWGATLIITDHYQLLGKADIQGVHIEDMRADFRAIRQEIGPDKTLGASANTFDDIRAIIMSGVVDYAGCGPFSVTTTKPNDYPLLGTDGYRSIVDEMKKAELSIPLLAVGGITLADVEPLLSTGIHGIAVASAINDAAHPAAALKEIYRKIY